MSARDALTVRPIRFTDDIPAWQTILTALGGVVVEEHPGWLVYELGAGRVALHAAAGSSQAAGTTVLGLETRVPLADAVAEAVAEGVPIELRETDHGMAGVVDAADGTTFTLDSARPEPPDLAPADPAPIDDARPVVSVMPVWHTPDARTALDVLDGLGLRRRVTLEDGSWADLTARSGGLHGVQPMHEPRVELAFELGGNVEDLREALASAGVAVELELEGTGAARGLRLADPDGGEPLRVAERQPDLYSYALSEM